VVQALPSLQEAALFVWTQPLAGLQESFVQMLPSSQLAAGPPTQLPASQVSFVVQALPSLQGAVLFTCMQARVEVLQESLLQGLPSSQLFEESGSQSDVSGMPSSSSSGSQALPRPSPSLSS
jgi:hypothetical protein